MELRRVPREIEEVEAIELRQVVAGARLRAAAEARQAQTPSSTPPETPSAAATELSPADLKALDGIRAMYQRLPPERLVAMCQAPPRGMEKLFAVLAREIGVEPAQPQGP
jgi:hypothetical protein